VNVLLRKDTIRRRLEDEATGITYTEFSYVLLQAYDFLRLFQDQGCRFQFGGQDQWGNIVGGIDLVRRVTGEKAYGAVFPLITTSSGVKFGKTEAGAVWLSRQRTSPYRFYQFWMNTEDADAGRYLRFFTLLPREEIEALEAQVAEAPQHREAQRRLAEEVTRTVHGEAGLDRARTASEVLFGGELEGLAAEEIADIFADVPSSALPADTLSGEGVSLVELLADTGLTTSRGEARRSVEQGGVYLNNRREDDAQRRLTTADTLEGRFLLLRKGKKRYHLVRVEG
jgi:tyrosyl-tRNA synthetase